MFHFFQRRGSFIAKTLVFRVSGQDKGKSWFILRPSCNLIALKPTESSQGSFATRPWIVILILAKSIDTMTNSTKFTPSLIPSRYSRFEISSFVYSFSKRTFISNLSPHFSCHFMVRNVRFALERTLEIVAREGREIRLNFSRLCPQSTPPKSIAICKQFARIAG